MAKRGKLVLGIIQLVVAIGALPAGYSCTVDMCSGIFGWIDTFPATVIFHYRNR